MRDTRLEQKIGFDRVRKAISDRCNTEYASNRVTEEEFSADPGVIRDRLLLTDEMRLILMFEDGFPSSGYIDCLHFLELLGREGANIDLLSLGKLRTLNDTLAGICSFFASVREGVYPGLKHMASCVHSSPEVSRRIDAILDRHGNVKDTASEALYDIRRSLHEKESSISKIAAAVLRRAQQEGIAESDAGVTVRDGKVLIPVASSHKRRISGFVYDESASGKTSFVQPIEIINIENDISELHFAEQREIFRILSEFSDWIRPFVPDFIDGAVCVGEMDFIMAKASVALDMIAGMPVISRSGEMDLRKARHPLLERALRAEGKEIVPLTVSLTPAKHILLISGPNAGGKSVCLKTVGLLQYMFQWGTLIPTSESSEMMVFDRIMVDIGDGQSIDNDLSTYSAFLDQMKNMLEKADDRTLVLIDEFGSGTEPAAGGAIAEAILSEFDRRGTYGVLTTHYTNLKLYASSNDSGVINGAMQFDSARIAPLFRLETGMPGNSFAFELARKMGLPEYIVKDAESRAGEEYVGIERNLKKIARNRRALDEKLQKIRKTDQTLENITDKYQKELQNIRQMKKDILDEAHKEAEEIVKGANRQVENTIRSIRESQAEKEKTQEARRELQNFVSMIVQRKENDRTDRDAHLEEKLRQLEARKLRQQQRKDRRLSERERAEAERAAGERKREAEFRNAPLKVGEKVRVRSNGMVGEVSRVSGKAVTIIVGSISSKMPLDRVERISSNEYKAAVKAAFNSAPVTTVQDSAISERKLNFRTELDIRGARVGEALDIVMKYVDDAIMLGVPSVRIIHGKGTGALRDEIQKFVRTTPGVASVRDEHIQYGGTGVTIVSFE